MSLAYRIDFFHYHKLGSKLFCWWLVVLKSTISKHYLNVTIHVPQFKAIPYIYIIYISYLASTSSRIKEYTKMSEMVAHTFCFLRSLFHYSTTFTWPEWFIFSITAHIEWTITSVIYLNCSLTSWSSKKHIQCCCLC